MRILLRLSQLIDRINETTGVLVSWLALAMMLLTCIIVLVRYVFNLNSIALQESVMYLHGTLFMLGIAYTLKHDAHVSVDVVSNRFSDRTRAFVNSAGIILFLMPVSAFLFFISLGYVSFSWSLFESSAQPGGLPGVFLLKTLIPVMCVLLFLQGCAELIRNFTRLRKQP